MTEITNSTCDSDVSVSAYSGTHLPHQRCGGMHFSKNLIWSMGVHVPVPVWAEPGKGLWYFLKDWCEALAALPGEFKVQKRSPGEVPARGSAGCGGDRRENAALSPARAALPRCLRQPGPAPARDLRSPFRSFGFERQYYWKVFMCSYLGRSSSNGLTRYLYLLFKFSEHCQLLYWLLYSVSEKTVIATEHGNWSLQPGFLFCYKQNHYSHLPFSMKATSTVCGHLFTFF